MATVQEGKRAQVVMQRRRPKVPEEEALFRAAIDRSPDAFLIALTVRDGQGKAVDFRFVYANKAAEAQLKRPRGELLGKRLSRVFPEARPTGLLAVCLASLERGEPTVSEQLLHVAGAGLRSVRWQMDPFHDGLAISSRDVSNHRRTEARLHQVEQRFRLLVENVTEYAIFMVDGSGRIASWNSGAERIYGYRSEEVIGKHKRFLHPETEAEPAGTLLALALSRGGYSTEGIRRRKDGSQFEAAVTITPLRDAGGLLQGYGVVTRDVTLRKRSQAAQSQLAAIVESSEEAIVSYAVDGELLTWNAAAERLMGYRSGEVLHHPVTELLPEGRLEEWRTLIARVRHGEQVHSYETLRRARDGSLIPVALTLSPIRAPDGEVTAVSALWRDISPERKVIAMLRRSLEQKEVLLREVHHRVKNNLQIIASLLGLQSARTSDQVALQMLEESQTRVRAIAALYEKMQWGSARVELSAYLSAVATQLVQTLGGTGAPRLRADTEEVWVEVDQATPCGLWVNEVVSNSIKHAFPAGRRGEIRLRVRRLPDHRVEVEVSDDGVGIPPGVTAEATGTLGLQLVASLGKQLGECERRSSAQGTAFALCFPITETSPSGPGQVASARAAEASAPGGG